MVRKTMKRRASDDDDSGSEAGAPVSKKSKSGLAAATTGGSIRDGDGNTYWPLSKNRRVTVSEFRGSTLINLREYYEKDGKILPGKKGISLSLAQYGDLLKAIPAINAELKKKGQDFDDPDVNVPVTRTKTSTKPYNSKANIESTSEEED